MNKFSKREINFLKRLNTPAKVQDFLNTLRFNFEKGGEDTIRSPLRALRAGEAHCLEGAILGAYILSLYGHPPLIIHLKAAQGDFDHCVAPFQVRGLWGALSKTNHAVLRYREPLYRSLRELAMSYFHEYFLDDGTKTLRQYSKPLNLSSFVGYEIAEEDLWAIDEKLDKIKHYDIAPKSALAHLRPADNIERQAGKIVEYRKR